VAEHKTLRLPCPLCGEEHTYELTVTRSRVLGAGGGASLGLPEVRRSFARLVVCPKRGERFQAELTLTETAIQRIESLELSEAGGDARG
jgi:hypothetical protein